MTIAGRCKTMVLSIMAIAITAGLVYGIFVSLKDPHKVDPKKLPTAILGEKPARVDPPVNATASMAEAARVGGTFDDNYVDPAPAPTVSRTPAPTPAAKVPDFIDKVVGIVTGGNSGGGTTGGGNGGGNGTTPATGGAMPTASQLADFLKNFGKQDQVLSVTQAAKQALADSSYDVCAPSNGGELVSAIKVQRCSYIRLTAGATYTLGQTTIDITQPTVIVGNPAFPPLIDATKAQRAFHVLSGGYLQLSFTQVNRGSQYKTPDGNFMYTRGGSVLLEPGSGAVLLGCTFSQPLPQSPDIKSALIIGGHILQLGGELFITGCNFLNLTPYSIRAPVFLGGDILVVAGIMVETASTHTQIAFIAVAGGSGLFVSILGGVGIVTGCTFTRALVGAMSAGAGIQVSIGGGVGIFTGATFVTNGGCFSFFGAGVHQFVGAGVLVNTGVTTNMNLGIAMGVGTGPLVTIGAGIFVQTGGAFVINAGGQFIAFSGGMGFIGPGSAQVTGVAFARNFGMLSAWGLGGQLACQAGSVQVVGAPSTLNAAISASWFLGHQFWLGAGDLTEVGVPSSRMSALRYLGGQGTHAWVGAGVLTVVGSPDYSEGYGYRPPTQRRFWIQGTGSATGAVGSFTPVKGRRGLFMDGEGGEEGEPEEVGEGEEEEGGVVPGSDDDYHVLHEEEGGDEVVTDDDGARGEYSAMWQKQAQTNPTPAPTIAKTASPTAGKTPTAPTASPSTTTSSTHGSSSSTTTSSSSSDGSSSSTTTTTSSTTTTGSSSSTGAAARSNGGTTAWSSFSVGGGGGGGEGTAATSTATTAEGGGGEGEGGGIAMMSSNKPAQATATTTTSSSSLAAATMMRSPVVLPPVDLPSRVIVADVTVRDVENGRYLCVPPVGMGNGKVEECAYRNVTVEGCNTTTTVFDTMNATNTCAEDETLLQIEERDKVVGGGGSARRARQLLEDLQSGKKGGATYILRTDMLIACPDRRSCPTTATVKSVVKDYLSPLTDAAALTTTAIRISVASAAVDPLVADLLPTDPEAAAAPSGFDSCPSITPYSIFVVVSDDEKAYKDAESMLGAMNDDPVNGDLTNAIKKTNPSVCVMASGVGFSYTVPSLAVPGIMRVNKALSKDLKASIAPVVNVKSADTGKVVDTLLSGRNYTIEVLNFPPQTSVLLSLSRGDDLNAPPDNLGVVVMDGSGVVQKAWTAPKVSSILPSSTATTTTVYLSASNLFKPGVVAQSALLDLKEVS